VDEAFINNLTNANARVTLRTITSSDEVDLPDTLAEMERAFAPRVALAKLPNQATPHFSRGLDELGAAGVDIGVIRSAMEDIGSTTPFSPARRSRRRIGDGLTRGAIAPRETIAEGEQQASDTVGSRVAHGRSSLELIEVVATYNFLGERILRIQASVNQGGLFPGTPQDEPAELLRRFRTSWTRLGKARERLRRKGLAQSDRSKLEALYQVHRKELLEVLVAMNLSQEFWDSLGQMVFALERRISSAESELKTLVDPLGVPYHKVRRSLAETDPASFQELRRKIGYAQKRIRRALQQVALNRDDFATLCSRLSHLLEGSSTVNDA
jgi:hypothetical protein